MSLCTKLLLCWQPKPPDYIDTLKAELELAHRELQMRYKQFDQITEDELIDASSYELKAAEMRYNWLMKQAKQAWAQQRRDESCQQ